jgi:hypothetical protein
VIKFAIGGVLMIGIMLSAAITSAAPVALLPTPGVDLAGTLVEKAKYCRFWQRRCAWKSWDRYSYRRCLWEHGC